MFQIVNNPLLYGWGMVMCKLVKSITNENFKVMGL